MHIAIHCTVKDSFLGKLLSELIKGGSMYYDIMPPKVRYAGTVNVHIPPEVRRGIAKIMKAEEKTKSEALRELLAIGLKARGIKC